MRKIINFMVILVFFVGCSSKEIIHEPIKNEILAYTQKAEIISQNERALIVATYTNPIQKSDDENFIISINPADFKILNASVNGDFGVKFSEISNNDERLNKAGFNLPWARHYELIAPTKDSKKLVLVLKISQNDSPHEVRLEFAKVAKSLYWNP